MKKNVEVEINFSGEDMAEELWRCTIQEQASFLFELARMYRFDSPNFLLQLEYLSDEINSYGTPAKDLVVGILERALEYIKGEENDT